VHAFLVTYSLDGATSTEHAELCAQLAPAVAAVSGLVSATWLANEATGRYGGFYLFETRSEFDRFVASELFDTLRSHRSVRGVAASDFAVDREATEATRGQRQGVGI
jgi:Putative mono-oxygenase ydhR